MRLTESRRQAVASNAIAHVVQSAILEIRTMAFRREPLLSEIFPGVDYQEQIRLIADVCDTLVPALRSDEREKPIEALQYTWESRDENQRRWLRHTLARAHVDVMRFV